MRKIRKLPTAVLAGAMLVGLCACGGGQTVDKTVEPAKWQNVAEVAAVELLVDEENGEYKVQIPQFVEAEGNAVLTGMNERLQAKIDEYYQGKVADGLAQEFIPLVMDTENYLSVVLYEAERPSVDTDGAATAYVYDKMLKTKVGENLAWSLAGATDDGIAEAIVAYCAKELNTAEVDYCWTTFNTQGYYVDTDGKMALVLSVAIKPRVENPQSHRYLLVYKSGQIVGRLIDTLPQ